VPESMYSCTADFIFANLFLLVYVHNIL
jgi:hypothetical protein